MVVFFAGFIIGSAIGAFITAMALAHNWGDCDDN